LCGEANAIRKIRKSLFPVSFVDSYSVKTHRRRRERAR
jgi:hypothetical protein